jgi:hypothetical protein
MGRGVVSERLLHRSAKELCPGALTGVGFHGNYSDFKYSTNSAFSVAVSAVPKWAS